MTKVLLTAFEPIDAIVNQLKQAQIPAAISNSAGLYPCNRLFYSAMHDIAVEKRPIRAGFIHRPYLHEQTVDQRFDFPSMSRETMTEAVRLAVEVTLQSCSNELARPDGMPSPASRA